MKWENNRNNTNNLASMSQVLSQIKKRKYDLWFSWWLKVTVWFSGV
jgi:hypothetical protein